VLVNLARTLLKRQQYDESISLCRKALVACPRNAGTVALMAYAHHCAQRFDQAIDLYHQVHVVPSATHTSHSSQALSLDASHVFSGQMLKIALEEAMSSNDALSEAMAGMSEEAESSFMDGAHIAESSPSFALPPIRAAPQHLDESVHSSEMSFV
jgi:tetratricopeptide (TPR) repeat protein